MIAVEAEMIVATTSNTAYADYPFSCRSAVARHLRWMSEYAACGDAEEEEQAELDLRSVHAELAGGLDTARNVGDDLEQPG